MGLNPLALIGPPAQVERILTRLEAMVADAHLGMAQLGQGLTAVAEAVHRIADRLEDAPQSHLDLLAQQVEPGPGYRDELGVLRHADGTRCVLEDRDQ